ncbi:hypothetical protein Tco_1374339 [Tanacetum coccineum]
MSSWQFDLCLGKELAGNVGAVDESSLNLTTTLNCLWRLRLEAIGGCDQKPLEAAIMKPDVQIWRLSHDLKRERNLYKELDDEGGGMIPVMEWLVRNLTEGVDWETERLNAISKRLSVRLYKRLGERLYKRFSGKLFRRCGIWYMFGTEGRFEASESFGTSGSSVDRLSIFVTDLLTSDSELELSHGAAI